ncbi:MAG: hypothetical protein ABII71_02405 [Candidatus Micrarchaeota archaeon]
MSDELLNVVANLQIAFDASIRRKNFPISVRTEEGLNISVVGPEDAIKLAALDARTLSEQGIELLVNPKEIPNYSTQRGALESACRAAAELSGDYDVGIGIAKKGMWLSFIFSTLGLTTYDIMVVRDGGNRTMMPMDRLSPDVLDGSRVLLFDNDAITGGSANAIAALIRAATNPKHIDVLLVNGYAHLKQKAFKPVRDQLAQGQHLGVTKSKRHVIDTLEFSGSLIRRKMALDRHFKGTAMHLNPLKVRLGVAR